MTLSLPHANDPQVAVDAHGDGVFAWSVYTGYTDRIQTRARSATGILSPVQTISPDGLGIYGASFPKVDVDADGDAVFTWRFHGDDPVPVAQARARSSTGGLGPRQDLGPSPGLPEVAVNARGDAAFTWYRTLGGKNRVQARTLSAEGVLGPVHTLSAPGSAAAGAKVAIAPDGDAVFVWSSHDGTTSRIETRTLSAERVLGPVRPVAKDPEHSLQRPEVALDAGGDAVFTWTRFDHETPSGVAFRVEARTLSGEGAFGPLLRLSPSGEDAWGSKVAVDAAGNAVFLWGPTPLVRQRGSGKVQARTLSAAGVLGPVETVAVGVDEPTPQVAVDPGGNAVIVWSGDDGVTARALSRFGSLGPSHVLGPGESPQVAVDRRGDATVTWLGHQDRVLAAFGP